MIDNYPRLKLSRSEKNEIIERLRKEQDNTCYLCGIAFDLTMPEHSTRRLILPHLDHNHETGAPRKLLCGNCNTILTRYERDIDIGVLVEMCQRRSEEVKRAILQDAEVLSRIVPTLKELQSYIERGECSEPHIMASKEGWRFLGVNSLFEKSFIPYLELSQLRSYAMHSEGNWRFIQNIMTCAARECIALFEQEREIVKDV